VADIYGENSYLGLPGELIAGSYAKINKNNVD